jgi:hypothetical protein
MCMLQPCKHACCCPFTYLICACQSHIQHTVQIIHLPLSNPHHISATGIHADALNSNLVAKTELLCNQDRHCCSMSHYFCVAIDDVFYVMGLDPLTDSN